MSQTFGARLREQRERHGVDLAAVAAQTKIKGALLQSLERDDVSQWPSGIYRRAYVRAYAQAIGLDADTVLREFMDAYPDPDEAAAAAADAAAAQNRAAAAAPQSRLREMFGSALGSLARLSGGPTASEKTRADTREDTQPHPSRLETQAPGAVPVTPVAAPAEVAPVQDLMALARLSTEFGKVDSAQDVQRLLKDAGRILEARGIIVWLWDTRAEGLKAVLVHGYSPKVRAQLPTVRRDDENPTAAAFRSRQTTAVGGSDRDGGALAVPLVGRSGCEGVLAIELSSGRERTPFLEAAATILAALIAQLVGRSHAAAARPDVPDAPAARMQPVSNYTATGSLAHARP